MTAWLSRVSEERSLLNPAFCGTLLWRAARGHQADSSPPSGMAFETAFLILPIILHRQMREALPRTVATSLPAWLTTLPLARSQIATRARLLVPFTKEALAFGGLHGLLTFSKGTVFAAEHWAPKVSPFLKESSEEVQECGNRADLLGRWFARAGSAETVMSILGIQP